MEESRFKILCRFYVSSLFALTVALPLASDPFFKQQLGDTLSGLFASSAHESNAIQEDWDKNRVHLSFEDSTAARLMGSMSTIVVKAANKHKLDPALVKAVIHVESKFDSSGVSPKGALGVMQLMPATARRLGVKNVRDPIQNIYCGSKYLRHLLDMFDNDLRLALAAYNAGPAKVRYYKGVPPYPETQNYVKKVMSAYRGYREMYS
ncbi:MAG: lytic transglycosylase domain-containing protein [SAR324 cluster bacterium]|uniref:Lytic transglycosylase domain-containing protein n=1 Tax=SAR324 cluster bacterium TaxID=2024889 RepID=A0A7X9IKK3_9DELT|nr:lytic transglycosylase domain-containing protein [SAR324 cluster bacterium]